MKEIKAIIQPHMLDRVMAALHALPHFPGATLSDCQGQGRGRGPAGYYEPDERSLYFNKKIKLEVLCADQIADSIVETIQRIAHTGLPGDGMIMVVDLSRVVRIRTGEEQNEAV